MRNENNYEDFGISEAVNRVDCGMVEWVRSGTCSEITRPRIGMNEDEIVKTLNMEAGLRELREHHQ